MAIGNMLMRPQRSYTRQTGIASGLGQRQPQTCPSGYRWNVQQGRCVAVNMPKAGFWNQVAQGVSQAGKQQMNARQPMQSAPKPMFNPQPLPKPNQMSPYAQLMAHAIDLHPPLSQVPQPYYQQQPTNMDMMNPAPMPKPVIEQQWQNQQMNLQPYQGQVNNMYQQQPIQQQLAINPNFQRMVLGR